MSVINGHTNKVTGTVTVAKGPAGIAVDVPAGTVYVADSGHASVTVLAPCR